MKRLTGNVKTVITLLSLLVFGIMTGCSSDHSLNPLSPAEPTFVETLERTFDMSGAVLLNAESINGSINITGTTGSKVEIHARKVVSAPSLSEAEHFAREVHVFILEEGESIRVFCEYPDPPDRIHVEVSYEIECPRGTDLRLYTTNGGCRITGMRASVHAGVTNGYIDADIAELSGENTYYVTNGYIAIGAHEGIAPLTAATTNGNISMTLHGDFSGTLDARTVTGSIHCDYPKAVYSLTDPHTLTGTLGDGGPTPIVLRTVTGSISLQSY
jgi:hypothetical protein